ncbi:septal ring lytic transglycosylase RlpA family protein [Thermocoleostomius sinensis]|uniref:Probable endolytic peptidoglycan transglycosylase RlpA n=1 Tax=Thermocoleostomius sinensis A174 TaxID=2016057 RepID=A0A9E8ZEQ3_9CYAN|nr:septal ring lytic transglycosylase RlpA family protein [Thermocoleostomius sinensis]WAL60479.1 septal ring lytic transglycosylase RlpA family protein [Thermocoleostomius sinensis A174]
MNQKLWSGFTAATLLVTTLGIAPLSYADQPGSNDEVSEAQVPSQEPPSDQVASTSPSSTSNPDAAQVAEAVKVGEYQSEDQSEAEETITELVSHQMDGRQAVTLYVRDIPVLTFLGSNATSAAVPSSEAAEGNISDSEIKVASVQNRSLQNSATDVPVARSNPSSTDQAGTLNAEADSNSPVWRATAIAARLNQYYRDNVDAETITAVWEPQQQRYLVKIGDEELVGIDSETILPNTTQDLAQDTLQITNLLRRQLGNAPPIQSISGDPRTQETRVSIGPFEIAFSGMASWYGPGFDGNYSASGEVFNQNALTAAHRTLPFGTQVRVTNMDNGLSVVVRINDRGPFHGDRVIDVSTAAAEAIGLVHSGVAPVSLEVLGTAQPTAY